MIHLTQALTKTVTIFFHLSLQLLRSHFREDISLLKQCWAQKFLKYLNIELQVVGNPHFTGPLILLGNHISYTDIPLLMACHSKISFLSKSEIKKWPLIGRAAKKMNTVFVERHSTQSRFEAKLQIAQSLQKNNALLAAFPSGTTSLKETTPWRHGLFQIAVENKIPVQFFKIHYTNARSIAYIDDDTFLSHLFNLTKIKKIIATIEFHEPVLIKNPIQCSQKWQKWTQTLS
ncbi:MAG: hypothetical protein A2622_13485 [Bdellovibrionales bacterium RIFCSPHIGHO2_01_FULL_40_29]|nr:MAG: hypothetical protein A2622_13485 [Bdellovibrionales bacterium RIFCSPHIGHO2_01_FULL_40_29]OFZ34291.1 MAG: hypothetical protein A3D17_04465 [Bdellovibrionales bacterium RIFCSPHIGHO2_02_FULL_40_15]